MYSNCFCKISASNLRLYTECSLFKLQIKYPQLVRKIPYPSQASLMGAPKAAGLSHLTERTRWEKNNPMGFTWEKTYCEVIENITKTMMGLQKKQQKLHGIINFPQNAQAILDFRLLATFCWKVCRCPGKFGWWSEADELDWTLTGLFLLLGGCPETFRKGPCFPFHHVDPPRKFGEDL